MTNKDNQKLAREGIDAIHKSSVQGQMFYTIIRCVMMFMTFCTILFIIIWAFIRGMDTSTEIISLSGTATSYLLVHFGINKLQNQISKTLNTLTYYYILKLNDLTEEDKKIITKKMDIKHDTL